MATELGMYKEQVANLERLLMESLSLFHGYNATLMQKTGKAPSTLKGCIQQVLKCPPAPEDKGYVVGAEYGYKDCIDLAELMADDTEKQFPNNKRVMNLATCYRKLAEGMQDRMNIMLEGEAGG